MASTGFAANEALSSLSAWSPYLVGVGIGLLVCISLLAANKPIGASSAYSAMAGVIGNKLAFNQTSKLRYFKEHSSQVDWSVIFLVGIIMGGFLAAFSGNELTGRFLPPLWVENFGEHSYALRGLVAFLGGIFLAFGARLAGGCTSGHGISGASQLAVGSWVSLICFFIGGSITAFLLLG